MTRPRTTAGAVTGTTSPCDGADWRDRAACLDEDPELFFPTGSTGPALLQIREAQAVCQRCEVMDTCLQWALDTGQDDGVWGGLDEDQRRSIRRRTRRATAAVPTPTKPTKTDPTPRPDCGRETGYRAHTDSGERQCDTCKAWRANRTSNRPTCGTGAGYRAHTARKEAACDPCKTAKRAESAEYRRQQRTSAA